MSYHVVLPMVTGLTEGLVLTVVSVGLALTWGMMGIVNMAHGGFFMLGAFVECALLSIPSLETDWGLVVSIVGSVAVVALLGVVLEPTIYRRMYGRDHVSSLLGTFALMLVFEGAVQQIWGVQSQAATEPTNLVVSSVTILGARVPMYYVIMGSVALVSLLGLWALIFRTNIGLWTRAIAQNRAMAAVLGGRVNGIFVTVFGVGCALAGLAGALIAPTAQVDPQLGATYIIEAFAVVLVGGFGSLSGCVAGGLLLGLADAVCAIDLPWAAGYSIYVVMAVVLVFRPAGLLGRSVE